MLRSIDGKSLLIGALLVAVAVCAMGGVPWLDEQYYGRFTMTACAPQTGDTNMLVAGPDGVVRLAGSDVFILDTATGQVWSLNYTNSDIFLAPKLEGYAPEQSIDPDDQ